MSKHSSNATGGYISGSMFAVQEAYKTIRTNILLSVIKDGCKKIVVTSAVSGEGKSTTTVNVAISLAQAFNKVLVIDCDLRKPRVHKALGVSSNPGLSNILSGLSDIREAVRDTKYPNLWVLTAGLTAPNPAEMLASGRMSALIEELEKGFDYIIFDTPPINVVSDALPLIKLSDGVIMVVRSNYSIYKEIDKALSQLDFIGARLVGAIVNDDNSTDTNPGRYGYGKRSKDDSEQ